MTPADEHALLLAAAAGNLAAMHRLCLAHLPLARAVAGEYTRRGVPFDDLIGEALVGLVLAVQRYVPAGDSRLAYHAVTCIRRRLRRYTLAQRRIVRPPDTRAARKLLTRLRAAQQAIAQSTGERATAEQVAARLGVRASDVRDLESALDGRDVAVSPGGAAAGLDLPSAGHDAEWLAAERERAALLHRAIDALAPRERDIVRRLYLAGGEPTLREIAGELGVSDERVRQLEGRARVKIRAAVGQVDA